MVKIMSHHRTEHMFHRRRIVWQRFEIIPFAELIWSPLWKHYTFYPLRFREPIFQNCKHQLSQLAALVSNTPEPYTLCINHDYRTKNPLLIWIVTLSTVTVEPCQISRNVLSIVIKEIIGRKRKEDLHCSCNSSAKMSLISIKTANKSKVCNLWS